MTDSSSRAMRRSSLVVVPYDSGHHGRRMGRGPLHFLERGAVARLRDAGGDVAEQVVDVDAPFPTEIGTSFALYRALADVVRATVADGRFPLVLAGNCGSALGTLSGLHAAAAASSAATPLGVIWLDAHGDLNTPDTSGTGFLDGMALATLMGRCWHTAAASIPGFRAVDPAHVVLVGVRDLDPAEARTIAETPIAHVTAESMRTAGVAAALDAALTALARRVSRVYLHIDLDVHEPTEAQANQYAVPGGLSPAAVRDLVDVVAQRLTVAAAALTAYDPSFDTGDRMLHAGVALLERLGATS